MNTSSRSSYPVQMLRLKQVIECTGLSRTTIYEMMDSDSSRYDPSFPLRIQLTPGTVAWVSAEVYAWLDARIAQGPVGPQVARAKPRTKVARQ